MARPGVGQRLSALGDNRSSRGTYALVACAIVSVVLFTVSGRMGADSPFELVRGAFQTVTMPVRSAGALVMAPFQNLSNVVSNLTASQETLAELQAQNEELQARNIELEEAEKTAERLRGLLDLKSANELQSTAARVISGSTDSWSTSVTIDKGTSSGITVGMPVSAAGGVIGQVIECGPTTSTVRLLTDENSSVSAMVQATRAQGMLQGSATGQVQLTLVRTSQTVNVGDAVVTSGLGGVSPKGLPLGKVTSVEKTPGALYLKIVVEPFVSAENNEEVLVITSLTEGQRAGAEDILEADAQETSSNTDPDALSADALDNTDEQVDAGAGADAQQGQ